MGTTSAKMKQAIADFYAMTTKTREQIERDQKTFIPDIAKDLERKAMNALAEGRDQTRAIINNAADDALRNLAEWAQLRGEALTSDANLFRYPITLTVVS